MKIGIITYHFAHNYGAVLQCYALQEYLKSNGHDVSIIDYRPRAITKFYDVVKLHVIKTYNPKVIIVNLASAIFSGYSRANKFNKFINNKLQLSVNNTEYDLIIYGSDQICNTHINNNDKTYWGYNNYKSTIYITYSESDDPTIPIDLNCIKNALNNFESISVREDKLAIELRELTNKEIYTTMDPVFLLPKKQWFTLSNRAPKRNDKYILLYNLTQDENIKKMAEEYSYSTGLKIIEIVTRVSAKAIFNSNAYSKAGPLNFLALFRDAEYVFTSSFHGTAFSIIFEKQFMSYMEHNKERVCNLLKELGINERISRNIAIQKIDYEYVNRKLELLTNNSKNYLINNTIIN